MYLILLFLFLFLIKLSDECLFWPIFIILLLVLLSLEVRFCILLVGFSVFSGFHFLGAKMCKMEQLWTFLHIIGFWRHPGSIDPEEDRPSMKRIDRSRSRSVSQRNLWGGTDQRKKIDRSKSDRSIPVTNILQITH